MNPRDISLGSLTLGVHHAPAVIAEIGSNHDGSLQQAIELIEAASTAGVDAVKFQLFHPEDLYAPGTTEHASVSQLALCRDWLPELKAAADRLSMEFLASAFCVDCVADLEHVGVRGHKIASSEATNINLVFQMAFSGKPILLSTGMSDLSDVARAVRVCHAAGNADIVLMQCTSLYPTPPASAHLRAMVAMGSTFGHHVGFSDHTLGNCAAISAVALGACVVEKHLTLSRSGKGPDHSYAAEPEELSRLCQEVADAYASLGSPAKEFLDDERHTARRVGIYAARDIDEGERIDPKCLDTGRPATGITIQFIDAVVNARAKIDIRKGDPIRWEHLK